MRQTFEVTKRDTIVYKGMSIDVSVLDAIVDTKNRRRVLWAFLAHDGEIRAIPFDESHVVWLQESDIQQPHEIEV